MMYFSGGQAGWTSTGQISIRLLRAARFINFVYSSASMAYLALCAISASGNFFPGDCQTIQMRNTFLSQRLRSIQPRAQRFAGYVIGHQFIKFAPRGQAISVRNLADYVPNFAIEFQGHPLALVN